MAKAGAKHGKDGGRAGSDGAVVSHKLPRKVYEKELVRLQSRLVQMQGWVRESGARIVVIFEGRDAAGKGGTIKRVTEHLNPRFARVAALPAPTERERTQWYFQRYVDQLPAAGEIVLFDRSWYNRAGVEKVMGFCTPAEYQRFMRQTPIFENLLIEEGILLRKYWFSVSADEQLRRFAERAASPLKQWKLSPMDLESIARWDAYSQAKDDMLVHTDTATSPWWVVEAENKRNARINMISHFLESIPWEPTTGHRIELPERAAVGGYVRPPREVQRSVPDHAGALS